MKAMILAAGLGSRMRPLTDHAPKPMLKVAEKPLIEHQINRLVNAGITDIVINTAYLAEQIESYLGNGAKFGCAIKYSREEKALETGGGIFKALPLLGGSPFLVVNGDVWHELDYKNLVNKEIFGLAHLVLVDNPSFNRAGDFYLKEGHANTEQEGEALTFSGISILNPKLFEECAEGAFKLAPLLIKGMSAQQITAEKYQGYWLDVGTPQRLNELNEHLNKD